ncbi:MAG: OmpA family protein [Desulfobulbaceae bacterium]|nr:OmpA family protein [Candidatus Kapabacteria bacterium]MBS3999056.1 OmpA family protein [Desulfobulbaceae bacterium]
MKSTIIILILIVLFNIDASGQAPKGEFKTMHIDKNRDTIALNRSYGDWWFGARGGPSALLYFGDLNLFQFPGEIENPFNSILNYSSGSGLGYFIGLTAEWIPVNEVWGAGFGVNFLDKRTFTSETRPIQDSLDTKYEVVGANSFVNLNLYGRYNFPLPGLHGLIGFDLDLMVGDDFKQRKKFINTGDISQDQTVAINNLKAGIGFHIGIGYDIFSADIINWGRLMMTPFVSLHIASSSIGDNDSKWNVVYGKAGLAIKLGKDKILYDTLKYDPLFEPPPAYFASVQDSRGIEFAKYIPAEALPSATIDLVRNPVLLGELRPSELKETERPKVTTPETPLINVTVGQANQFRFPTSTSTGLSKDVKEYLDAVANYLLANPNAEVRIVGHSDNQGSLSENTERSRARANNARQYLIARGVPGGKVLSTFSGSLSPVAPNNTEAGRRQNRRIEIVISSK